MATGEVTGDVQAPAALPADMRPDGDVQIQPDTLPEPTADPARLASALQQLSEIGGDGRASVSRLAFTPAERQAHAVMGE